MVEDDGLERKDLDHRRLAARRAQELPRRVELRVAPVDGVGRRGSHGAIAAGRETPVLPNLAAARCRILIEDARFAIVRTECGLIADGESACVVCLSPRGTELERVFGFTLP